MICRVACKITLAEIKLFLNGFREDTPVSTRWRELTNRKIAELQQRPACTRRLLHVLERLQHRRCIQLHQCVTSLSLSPRLAALRTASKIRHSLRDNSQEFASFAISLQTNHLYVTA